MNYMCLHGPDITQAILVASRIGMSQAAPAALLIERLERPVGRRYAELA